MSLGLTASEDDDVNCDCTEEVGAKIQQKIDSVTVTEASLKRSDQIRSLNHLQPGIQINKKKYHIDLIIFFSRLIAIVQREEDMTQYFKYELTAFPTSLFKDAGMLKMQISQLAKAITTDVEPADCSVSAVYVIDVGTLLHKSKRTKKATYKYIVKQYISYVRAKYGQD